jgi:hypothetical protein
MGGANNIVIVPISNTLVPLLAILVLTLVLLAPIMISSSFAYSRYIVGIDTLTQFDANSIVGIAGYYALSDKYQHVIVATKDGTITEVYFSPKGIFRDVLANIQGTVGITAYAAGCLTLTEDHLLFSTTVSTTCDGSHVGIVKADGTVTDIYWGGTPYSPITQNVMGKSQVPFISHLASYYKTYSASSSCCFPDFAGGVTSASSDGKICNQYLGVSYTVCTGSDVLAQFDGIVGYAGYFTPTDEFQHAIVATNDGTLHEVFFKDNPIPPPAPPSGPISTFKHLVPHRTMGMSMWGTQ